MPVLEQKYLEQLVRTYRSRMDNVDEIVSSVMLEAYKDVTGKKPSDRFREKIEEAVAYDQ